ncbi:peptidase E [Flavobacteriaceae bacterium S0825]|nr:peptidase E [Flavobacteriaceae bacterium S0825]
MSFTITHKYYVSVTEVEYVKEQESVQIVTRIFIDDFEKMLRERYDESITLDIGKDETQIDAYIQKYLSSKLQITIDNTLQQFEFLGKEYEDDILFCYLEITDVSAINNFEIVNQVLFDVFDDQQNLVKTKINSKRKSFMLIPQNDKGVLNFN